MKEFRYKFCGEPFRGQGKKGVKTKIRSIGDTGVFV